MGTHDRTGRLAACVIAGASLIIGACRADPSVGDEIPGTGIPINTGFEQPAVEGFARPWGWRPVATTGGGTFAVDSALARSGRRSLRLEGEPADGSAVALQSWIEPRFAHGREVSVSAWIRSEGLRGRARLIAQTWGAGVLAADTASVDGSGVAPDTDDWHRVEIRVPVDASAHALVLQAELEGGGTVWLDDVAVEMDGRVWESVPAADPPDRETLAWLEARSSALRTVDASAPGLDDVSDLTPFGEIVGNARIVALGEATHGTSEFFRAKHRLLAYLVEQLGFGVFAIEANQLDVEPINEYVLGGPGDTRALMRAMFAVWNTEEMEDLIEWMRAFNATGPDRPVEFIGFDMQDPKLPIDSVSAWIGRVEPTLRPRVDSLYGSYREAWRETNYPQAADSVRERWYAGASEVFELMTSRRERWLARETPVASAVAVDRIVHSADLARQAALSALTAEFATRDSAMAENLRWTLDRSPPDTRVVIWAHDGHVSRSEHEDANYWGGGSMGGWLSRMYGDDYRVFGLLTFDGAYSGALGREIIDTRLLPAPAGTLEEALHRVTGRLDAPLLVTDLRDPTDGPRGWLLEPRPIRMIGYAAEDLGLATGISVGAQFDAVVFVDRTSPSRVFR